jgi:hypothetical protein
MPVRPALLTFDKPDPAFWRAAASRTGAALGPAWWHVAAYADYDLAAAGGVGRGEGARRCLPGAPTGMAGLPCGRRPAMLAAVARIYCEWRRFRYPRPLPGPGGSAPRVMR